jgi:hypothetical protein
MFEADIINDGLMLGHSWRPSVKSYYGDLWNTYLAPMYQTCMENPEKHLWLDIEFKSGSQAMIDSLYHTLKVFSTQPNLHFSINACKPDSWKTQYRRCRHKYARRFFEAHKSELDLVWKDDFLANPEIKYTKLKLYPDSKWHF